MRESGKGMASVLSGAGLTAAEVDDPKLRLEVRTQIKVLDLAAQELQDECLGFNLARSFDLREIGLLYYVMASSRDLAEALRNAERYSGINNEGVRLRYRAQPATVISLEYFNVDRALDRHQIEFWLITVVRLCRELTGIRLAPKTMSVRHVRGRTSPEYRSYLGGQVEFGTEADEIVFAQKVAALPLVRADGYLNRLLRRYADEALRDRPQPSKGVRGQVERVQGHHLGSRSRTGLQPPHLVARALGRRDHLLQDPRRAQGHDGKALSEGPRAAGDGNRLAARIPRDRLIHPCLPAMDRNKPEPLSCLFPRARRRGGTGRAAVAVGDVWHQNANLWRPLARLGCRRPAKAPAHPRPSAPADPD